MDIQQDRDRSQFCAVMGWEMTPTPIVAWSRLWREESGFSVPRAPCQPDSVGYCTVTSRFDSGRLLLELSERGVYSYYTYGLI
jgi:hypothetical protein